MKFFWSNKFFESKIIGPKDFLFLVLLEEVAHKISDNKGLWLAQKTLFSGWLSRLIIWLTSAQRGLAGPWAELGKN